MDVILSARMDTKALESSVPRLAHSTTKTSHTIA